MELLPASLRLVCPILLLFLLITIITTITINNNVIIFTRFQRSNTSNGDDAALLFTPYESTKQPLAAPHTGTHATGR
jgi:hypothetical protein